MAKNPHTLVLLQNPPVTIPTRTLFHYALFLGKKMVTFAPLLLRWFTFRYNA